MKSIISSVIKEAKWINKIAIDFATKEQLDKYLQEHPGADKSRHKVVELKTNKDWSRYNKEAPKKEKLQDKIEEKKKEVKLKPNKNWSRYSQ